MKVLFLQESPMYEALGIHALAGVVKAAGHECDLLIESEERDFIGQIEDAKADLLAFSFMTRQQEWAINKINKIRRGLDVPILIGGTHPTMYPETLSHCNADYLCVGEGEQPVVDLLNRMAIKGRTDNIPNIHIKSPDGGIIKNEIRPLMDDWDNVAMPDRTIYWRYPFLQELPLKRFITSFGCAYKCSFCYINNYREIYDGKGKFFRRKSIPRVIAEMKATREKYPLRRIHYVDDIFSLSKTWVEKFLPIYWKEIGIPWSANIWIAHMSRKMVELFKENGCVGLTFGVESGNEKTRRGLIDKDLADDLYLKNCGYLKEYKIPFHTGNIIGLPGEGLEEAFQTARFNNTIGVTSARSALFWPFPGTKLTEYAMDHGMLTSDYSVEYFNRGIYPTVTHKDTEKLKIFNNMFQFVAKWSLFEGAARFLLKWPANPIVKLVATLADKSFWFSEAKFFGLLNWSGIVYWWHLRQSFMNIRRHTADPRFENDALAQRPFWNISQSDLDRITSKQTNPNRDGIT
ncbi:MAG: B12-binding domain-containing radical SAM protein [Elusimicrobia bacterium]|nr:B12-binding domain-containing radical SAM protein [Elusimicrobiota bacterium]